MEKGLQRGILKGEEERILRSRVSTSLVFLSLNSENLITFGIYSVRHQTNLRDKKRPRRLNLAEKKTVYPQSSVEPLKGSAEPRLGSAELKQSSGDPPKSKLLILFRFGRTI